MKTLYGMHRPDEGTVAVDGVEVRFRSPADAIAAGVGMVHQHFMLADNLTVLENVILGAEPTRHGRIDVDSATRQLTDLGASYGIELDLSARVEQLGVGQRQRVEILKVLYRGARILILDEPTAVLVPQEVDELFLSLRHLVDDGVTILFISHKLDEVLTVSDDITVIRAGTTVTTVTPDQVDRRRLGELMVGSELPVPQIGSQPPSGHVTLSLHAVSAAEADRTVIDSVSLEVHRGEIVGIAGVEGNGQFELVETILGLRPTTGGRIELDGESIDALGVRQRRHEGIAYIPFDRQREGLMLADPLWENMMLGHEDTSRFSSGPWLRLGHARAECDEAIERFGVATPGNDVPAYALSGGNQQKLIVGREMMAEPRLLVAAHPTRGVDIGAQAAIWEELRAARSAGLAVLLVSADLDELIGLSDRLLVMFRGVVTARLDPAAATPEQLGMYMAGERQTA